MAGNHGRHRATLFQPEAIHGDAGCQHQRLGIDRLAQCLGRAVGHQLPEVAPQRSGGFIEGGTNYRGIAVGGHHADCLRTLAGEHECEFHGCEILSW